MDIKKIQINSEKVGKRLDIFLTETFPNYSRALFQSQIKKGDILLNGEKTRPGAKLKVDDLVNVALPKVVPLIVKPEKNIKLNILFENDNFIVINKPAGIVVHPSESTPEHTIVNALLAYCPKISSVGDDSKRPGIVHRLDKEVSGVMIIAKNQKTFDHLKKQFQNRTIQKKYIALIHGKIIPSSGTINIPIGRSKSDPNRMSVKKSGDGREAITIYKTKRILGQYSLLEIEIKTGRTHQIRVHLLSKGNPIVGDTKYHTKKMVKNTEIKRVYLHAQSIRFTGINGEIFRFKADIPEDFKLFLKQLT